MSTKTKRSTDNAEVKSKVSLKISRKKPTNSKKTTSKKSTSNQSSKKAEKQLNTKAANSNLKISKEKHKKTLKLPIKHTEKKNTINTINTIEIRKINTHKSSNKSKKVRTLKDISKIISKNAVTSQNKQSAITADIKQNEEIINNQNEHMNQPVVEKITTETNLINEVNLAETNRKRNQEDSITISEEIKKIISEKPVKKAKTKEVDSKGVSVQEVSSKSVAKEIKSEVSPSKDLVKNIVIEEAPSENLAKEIKSKVSPSKDLVKDIKESPTVKTVKEIKFKETPTGDLVKEISFEEVHSEDLINKPLSKDISEEKKIESIPKEVNNNKSVSKEVKSKENSSKEILNDVIEQIQNNILESLLEQVKDHVPHRKKAQAESSNIENNQSTDLNVESESTIKKDSIEEPLSTSSKIVIENVPNEKKEFRPDTSINQNATFFYKPSVFKRYNINVINVEDLEKENKTTQDTNNDITKEVNDSLDLENLSKDSTENTSSNIAESKDMEKVENSEKSISKESTEKVSEIINNENNNETKIENIKNTDNKSSDQNDLTPESKDLNAEILENIDAIDVKDIEELIETDTETNIETDQNTDSEQLKEAASNDLFDSSTPPLENNTSSKTTTSHKNSIFSNISSVFKKFTFEKNGIVSAKDMFNTGISKFANKIINSSYTEEIEETNEELENITSNNLVPAISTTTTDVTFNHDLNNISIDMNSLDFEDSVGIANNLSIPPDDINLISTSSDLLDNVDTEISELDSIDMSNEEFTIDSTLDPAIDDEVELSGKNFVNINTIDEEDIDDLEETSSKKSRIKKDSSKKKSNEKETKKNIDKDNAEKGNNKSKKKNKESDIDTDKTEKEKASSSKSKKKKHEPEFENDNMFKLENNPEQDAEYLKLVYDNNNNNDEDIDDDFFSIEDYFGLTNLDSNSVKSNKKSKKSSRKTETIDNNSSTDIPSKESDSSNINPDELIKNVSKNISKQEASSLSQLLTSYTNQISTLSNKIAKLENAQNETKSKSSKNKENSEDIDLDNIDIGDIDINDIDLKNIDLNNRNDEKSIENMISEKFSKDNSNVDENMRQELLNEVLLDSNTNVSKEESPTDDFYTIIEALTKTISQLEGSGNSSQPASTQYVGPYTPYTDDNKSFNILIDKDDIFSISILNESYEIVADFDSISVLSQNIHIATPKKNFYVTVGEKYIEIHNTGTQFAVTTNFEDIEFANAINNVAFAKKDNVIELNVKEAFKLSSVNNKIELSMLNTNVAEIKKSNVETSESVDEASICDNRTLLISEETQKVYLPYTIEELMQKLNDSDEYQSLEDVIESEYTVPLSTFKMPIISRFKEAYKFMREKEHSSVYAAVDLALELMFNSNLNPAVIRASKDLKELNVYLDCLYENEIDKFDCFKIVYKVLPKIK